MTSDELIEKLKDAQKRYGILPVVSVNAGGSGSIDQVVIGFTPTPEVIPKEGFVRYEIQLAEGK